MDRYLHLLAVIKELNQISEWLNENKNGESRITAQFAPRELESAAVG